MVIINRAWITREIKAANRRFFQWFWPSLGLALIFVLLTACAGHAKLSPEVPPPIAKGPPEALCQAIEDPPPLEGGIPQPITEQAREATMIFLGQTSELYSFGMRGWHRAALAKEYNCAK